MRGSLLLPCDSWSVCSNYEGRNIQLSTCHFRNTTCPQDVSRMVNALPDVEIKEIHVAMVGVMQRMKVNLIADGIIPDKLPKRA